MKTGTQGPQNFMTPGEGPGIHCLRMRQIIRKFLREISISKVP